MTQSPEHDLRIMKICDRICQIDWILDTHEGYPIFGKEDLIKERADLKRYRGRIIGFRLNRHTGIITEDGNMNIIFEEPETHSPTFSMVAEGQLFVGDDGCLYQREQEPEDDGRLYAWMICDEDGVSRGGRIPFSNTEEISRILPKIKRINF